MKNLKQVLLKKTKIDKVIADPKPKHVIHLKLKSGLKSQARKIAPELITQREPTASTPVGGGNIQSFSNLVS